MSYWRAVCRETGKHGSGGDARKRPAMDLAGRLPYQIWAQARVDSEQLPFGTAIAGCWAVLKKRYDVAKYEHLPATEYNSCVDFIKRSYNTLTGEELTGEQLRFLDFDE